MPWRLVGQGHCRVSGVLSPSEPPQVAGILAGDAALVGRALDGDAIVEPVRGPLIPGFAAVKRAARAAGAPTPSRLSTPLTDPFRSCCSNCDRRQLGVARDGRTGFSEQGTRTPNWEVT